jgi:cytochrome P450
MASLSLQILLRSTFGHELSIAAMNEIAAVFPVLSQQSWRRTISLSWWCFPRLASGIPTPSNVAFQRARRRLDAIVRDLSAASSSGDDASLLSILKAAKNNDRPLSDELIRDEIVTFLIAGHETTASSLTWALYLLARNPDVWDRLHAEASATGSGSCLARAVVMESLRMYPPAWSIVRDAAQDDDIAGVHIPAGSVIITSPYATHRDPRFWERPDEFHPERFEQGPGKTEWDPRAYFPFGAGMRHCVGEHMAMRQAVDVIARIAGTFRPVLCDEAPVHPVPAVTLRQSRKVLARLREV